MARKKKIEFKLNPEWMLKEPVDFEYNKYTLLNYLQKCGKNFDEFRIYPDFVELSLHIANNQSLSKENVLLLTDKKFDSFDDEILLKELYPKIPRKLKEEERLELEKTLRYSNVKLIDTFNIAKSVWTIAFDNIQINVKKNRDNIFSIKGFFYIMDENDNSIKIWGYQIKKTKKDSSNKKLFLEKLYDGELIDENISNYFNSEITVEQREKNKKLPIFEVKQLQTFPLEETVLPIIKRKILNFIYQSKLKV